MGSIGRPPLWISRPGVSPRERLIAPEGVLTKVENSETEGRGHQRGDQERSFVESGILHKRHSQFSRSSGRTRGNTADLPVKFRRQKKKRPGDLFTGPIVFVGGYRLYFLRRLITVERPCLSISRPDWVSN